MPSPIFGLFGNPVLRLCDIGDQIGICRERVRQIEIQALDKLKQLMEKDAPAVATEEFGIKWQVPFAAEAKIGFRFGGLVKVTGTLEEALETMVARVAEQDKELREIEKKYGHLQLVADSE